MSTLAHTDPFEARRPNRRRRYLIRPSFQLRFAVVIGLTVFFACMTIGFALYSVLQQQARLLAMNPAGYHVEVPLVLVGFGFLFAVVAGGAFGVWCIYYTHRITGPLVVLEQYLNELAEGRFPKVRSLRKNDELKDLFATLDKAITSLRQGAAGQA